MAAAQWRCVSPQSFSHSRSIHTTTSSLAGVRVTNFMNGAYRQAKSQLEWRFRGSCLLSVLPTLRGFRPESIQPCAAEVDRKFAK